MSRLLLLMRCLAMELPSGEKRNTGGTKYSVCLTNIESITPSEKCIERDRTGGVKYALSTHPPIPYS